MSRIRLTMAMFPYDRVLPLLTGEVVPDGVDLEPVGMPGGPEVFHDQLRFGRYDVAEMSLASFLLARSRGWEYRALPVFHNRSFHYTDVLVRTGSGIRLGCPQDLRGKRIGVADYVQTAALWTRGILQHEFGVAPEEMRWFQERSPAHSLGTAAGFAPPAGVSLRHTTTDLGTMFLQGELDAAVTYLPASSMDRPKADLRADPGYSPLFPRGADEGARYFRTHGIYPAHHVTVIRERIVEEHPGVATALLRALEEAKARALTDLHSTHLLSLVPFRAQVLEDQRAVFGRDPYPYGIAANARMLERAQDFAVEQGLTERRQPWSELFPEEVLRAEDGLG